MATNSTPSLYLTNGTIVQHNCNNEMYAAARERISNTYVKGQSNPDLRLRYCTISNYRDQNDNLPEEPTSDDLTDFFLDMKGIYRGDTHCVITSWLSGNEGGVSGPTYFGADWNLEENQSYELNDRKQQYSTNSALPCVNLSSPFIWTGNGRHCGIDFVPPKNSLIITGKVDTGQQVILGYTATNPEVITPVLKPGEVSISGYGNNYIYWGQSDKINIYCKAEKDEKDLDDPDYMNDRENCKYNSSDCELQININANDRFIEILATEDNVEETEEEDTNYAKHNKYPRKPDGRCQTLIVITPQDVTVTCSDEFGCISKYKQDSESIYKTVTTNDGYLTEEEMTSEYIKRNVDIEEIKIEEELSEIGILRKVYVPNSEDYVQEEITPDKITKTVYKDEENRYTKHEMDSETIVKTVYTDEGDHYTKESISRDEIIKEMYSGNEEDGAYTRERLTTDSIKREVFVDENNNSLLEMTNESMSKKVVKGTEVVEENIYYGDDEDAGKIEDYDTIDEAKTTLRIHRKVYDKNDDKDKLITIEDVQNDVIRFKTGFFKVDADKIDLAGLTFGQASDEPLKIEADDILIHASHNLVISGENRISIYSTEFKEPDEGGTVADESIEYGGLGAKGGFGDNTGQYEPADCENEHRIDIVTNYLTKSFPLGELTS
jgi:hypothetical protein